MATANDTKTKKQIDDLQDLIDTKARQLRALLALTYGQQEPGEGFRVMSDELQDTYLWACADMAYEIVASLDKQIDIRLAMGAEKEVQA